MLYKYCPNCFSLDIKIDNSTRSYKCKCGYCGDPKQNSLDVINELRKSRPVGGSSIPSRETISPKTEEDFMEPDEKVKMKFGAKSKNADWEIL